MMLENNKTEKLFNQFKRNISYLSHEVDYILNKSNNFIREYDNQKQSINVSFIIICKNEEDNIERCLNSIKNQINSDDEIVIVDTGSTDNTLSIAIDNAPAIKVFSFPWSNDFSAVRNFGLKQAKNNWVFFIDADEILKEYSLVELKKYIKILEILPVDKVVINPTIVNSNGNVIQGVRRIINKKDNIFFFGLVHEEPRFDFKKYGDDIFSICFENIILEHDGYSSHNMIQKDKLNRNTSLLEKMMEFEPENPRWLYFYCRDGKTLISEKSYESKLNTVIHLSSLDPHFIDYKIRAYSDLIDYHLGKNNIISAEEHLSYLKNEVSESFSDIYYYEQNISLQKIKKKHYEILNEVINYRKSRKVLDYGSMHSNYFHIDFLISQLFFEVHEYDKSFTILKKLEEHQYGAYKEDYKELYLALKKYYEEF